MLFHTPVRVPWISTACNNSVPQQLVDGRRSVEEIRDDLMFNFTSTADLCDFVSYINEWLNLYIVCVSMVTITWRTMSLARLCESW